MAQTHDGHNEETRWRALVGVALADLPEIEAEFDEDTPRTPGMVWTTITITSFDDGTPKRDDDFWSRVLTLVELVEEAMATIADDPERSDDASELYAFTTAGVLCDVTRTPMGLQRLLPMMGPLSVAACREEVGVHVSSRGFGADAVNWSTGGSAFHRHVAKPAEILPAD
ncbi:MAG: hypothetical protein JWP32_2520 [Schumannella sp.]|nr:hypothetical protein [Schumannella sp.]